MSSKGGASPNAAELRSIDQRGVAPPNDAELRSIDQRGVASPNAAELRSIDQRGVAPPNDASYAPKPKTFAVLCYLRSNLTAGRTPPPPNERSRGVSMTSVTSQRMERRNERCRGVSMDGGIITTYRLSFSFQKQYINI
jgi:hypothetical protein